MPKLPDQFSLGNAPSFPSGMAVASPGNLATGADIPMSVANTGAGAVGEGIGHLGSAGAKIGEEELHQANALDLIKAEAYRRPKMMELENTFDRDPDHATFDQRFQPAAAQIDNEAAQMIANPRVREQFMFKAGMESTQARNRVLDKGTHLAKEQKYADTGDALSAMSPAYTNPAASDSERAQTLREMQGAIDIAKGTGLVDPRHAQHLEKTHIYGNGGVIYREAENRLWEDPLGTLKDLTNAGRGARRSDGQMTIQSAAGVPFTVNADEAARFKGAINDLEAAGITINPDKSGGYNPRNIAGTNTPSQHASGRAIDINWDENQQGTDGAIPADVARGIAAKWGLTWGGDWSGSKRDPMHFEVAKNAAPIPKSADDLTIPEGDRPARLPDDLTPSSDRYARLDPIARAHLITRAKTALHATLQQDLKDAEAFAERTGTVPVDDDGRTVRDRMARILTPNQISKGNLALDAAVGRYRATAGLSDLDDSQAEQRFRQMAPEEKVKEGLPYAIAAKNQQYAQKAYQKIQDLRAKDPAQSVMGGPLSVAGVPKVSVGADGQLTIDEGDTGNVKTRPAPEVQSAIDLLNGKSRDLQLTQGEDGTVNINPAIDPQSRNKALGSVIDARLAAQKRLGIPTSDQRAITLKEAQGLLDMRTASSLSTDEFQAKINDAVKTAKEAYGPYAGRALSDAVKLIVKDRQNKETGLDLAQQLITGRIDPDRLLQERGARSFDDRWWKSGAPTLPSNDAGGRAQDMTRRSAVDQPAEFDPWMGQATKPGLSPTRAIPTVGAQPAMGSEVAAPGIVLPAYPEPTEAQRDWLTKNGANPSARTVFDSKFGPGASKRYGHQPKEQQ